MRARILLRIAIYLGLPLAVFLYAHFIEPFWITVNTIELSDKPTVRIVHISDTHYKGEKVYLIKAVDRINALKPDVVCFTGDLAEEDPYYEEALHLLKGLEAPLICVPGNHDPFLGDRRTMIEEACKLTGGAYLLNTSITYTNLGLTVIGTASPETVAELSDTDHVNVVLTHYPSDTPKLSMEGVDLVLAGHSHGGQVRLPFVGAFILPNNVDEHDLGLNTNGACPVYVNSGLGTFLFRIRFMCRPEITVFEL